MNKIHSSVLALILSIFLIQAADPPYGKTGVSHVTFTPSTTQQLHSLYQTLQNIQKRNDTEKLYNGLDHFLSKSNKSEDEQILEHNFVRPLLTQYQEVIHQEPSYPELPEDDRISKEDYVENFKVLSEEDLNLLLRDKDKYQDNHPQENKTSEELSPPATNGQTYGTIRNSLRRDDHGVTPNDPQEHIGEILPPDFKFDNPVEAPLPHNPLQTRKSYAYNPRSVVTFPVEPSGEGFTRGYRYPKRLRAPYDYLRAEQARETYFEPSARFQTVWGTSRRPRVIFPSDLVQFREPVNSGTAPADDSDWLAPDNALQDLEGADNRDRGEFLLWLVKRLAFLTNPDYVMTQPKPTKLGNTVNKRKCPEKHHQLNLFYYNFHYLNAKKKCS